MMIELPDWYAIRIDEANPLERFIYENEPAGKEEESAFRDGLREALEWVVDQPEHKRKTITGPMEF